MQRIVFPLGVLLLFAAAIGCEERGVLDDRTLPALAVERLDAQGRPVRSGSMASETPQAADLAEVKARVHGQVSEALDRRQSSFLQDQGLDLACRRTAEELALGGDTIGAPAALRTELKSEYISDVSYLPFTFHIPLDAPVPEAVLGFIQSEARHRGITHLGVGVARSTGQRALVTLVLLRRLVGLSAFPYQVRADSRHHLWIHPASSLVRDPQVLLATPSGDVIDLPVVREGAGAVVRVPFERGRGRYVIQVLADNSFGTQVTNQMDVWMGEPTLERAQDPSGGEQEWGSGRTTQEAQMMSLLNAYRTENGLRSLRHDDRLTRTARAHSEDMRDHRFFGHRSPRHGDLGSRVRRLQSPGQPLVLENIAMSLSVSWAHDGLVASPSHRRNLLDARVTHVGVGVAVREAGPVRVVYVTQHMGALKDGTSRR